jgi:TPR repeat protein
VKIKKNPNAMFTLYGLSTLGLYNQLSKAEADEFLLDAAKQNHLPSIIELANNYYSGKSKNGNVRSGLDLWKQAAENGSIQAKIRLAAANIFDAISVESPDKSIQTLKEASKLGSVLAQISLAYSYENGIGVETNKSEAVKYYRLTAQRGNQFGYEELKRIYNEIRPGEKRFSIN